MVLWFCKLKLVYNLLCLVLWSFTCQLLFCLSWPLQWKSLSTEDRPVFKTVCSHLDSAQLTLSWKNPSHWGIASPSVVCCITFQVAHALSGTSSSLGQSKGDIPVFKYFLKENPIMLVGAECYSIVNKGPSNNRWLPAVVHYSTQNQGNYGNYHCLVINSVTVV